MLSTLANQKLYLIFTYLWTFHKTKYWSEKKSLIIPRSRYSTKQALYLKCDIVTIFFKVIKTKTKHLEIKREILTLGPKKRSKSKSKNLKE